MSEQERRMEWRREFLERWWKHRPLWVCPDVNEVDDYVKKWTNEGDE
ncbi:MAG: hypothetical protein ACRDTJ_17310 [Pseudonocardiaceae bacterium]